MPDETQRAIDAAKKLNDLGFVEFTTGLLDGVYETIVQHQIDQLRSFSELVAQVSGTVEDFVLNTSGLDVADPNGATAPQNASILNSYIDEVLGIDSSGASADVTPQLATHFAADAANGQLTVAEPANSITLDALRALVFEKIKADAKQHYNLLLEIIRIGYARLDTTGGFVETGLDFRVSSNETYLDQSSATDIRANRWYVNGSVGASFKKWGFRVNGGYSSDRLRVNLTSSSKASSISTDIRMTGRVRVEFATSTFDTSMAKIRNA